jgi:hypothetical protein
MFGRDQTRVLRARACIRAPHLPKNNPHRIICERAVARRFRAAAQGFFARDPGYTHIALRKLAPSAGKVLRAIKRLDFVRTHGRPR